MNVNEKNPMIEEFSEAAEYVQMGQVLVGSEHFEDAIILFDKALEMEPMNRDAYISKGIALANLEDFDSAKECFKRSIKIDKNFADAYYQLGNIDFLQDDFQEGLSNYNQAIALGYNDVSIYYNLALAYEDNGNIDEAIRYYTRAAAMDDTNPEYLIRKASLQIVVAKYEEALQTLERVINRFPDSFEGYHLSAAAYTLTERYDEADNLLQRALALFPDDTELLFDRIRILITKGDMQTAEMLIAKAKNENYTPEQMKEILLNEAKIKGQSENLSEMIELLERALQIPEGKDWDSEIRYFLMNAYLVNKEFDELKRIASQVNADDSMDPYNLCGKYYLCLAAKGLNASDYTKDFEDAVKYYRSISVNDPSRVDAYLFRAMCYRELQNYDKALESVDYVLLLQPDNAQLHYIKGNLLKDQGKNDEAQKEHDEAKKLGINPMYISLMG